MGEAEINASVIKRTLKSLCVSNAWSYAVFWRFDHRNPMLLTVEDAYYEDQVGAVLDNMLLMVHLLGEGTIGQAALSGKHRWILEDDQSGEWDSVRSSEIRETFQDDSDVSFQFSSGIKTIAAIPIEPRGVVQFGSTEKICENFEFVDQTTRLFRDIENLSALNHLENAHSSEEGEMYDINGLFASLISNNRAIPLSGFDYNEMQGNNCSAMNSSQSSPSTSDVHSGRMEFSNMNFEQALLRSTCSVNNASNTEYPTLASHNHNSASESRLQVSPDVILWKGNSLESCRNTEHDVMEYSMGALTETERNLQASSRNLTGNQHSVPSVFATQSGVSEQANSLERFPELFEEFKSADFTTDLFNFCQGDDLSQWFASSPDQNIGQMVNALSGELTQLVESTSTSSCLVGGDMAIEQNPAKKDMFHSQKLNVGCDQTKESWEDILMPLMAGNNCPTTSSASGKCVLASNATTSMSGPKKGLFSELGLEELLVGASSSSCLTKSSFEDQSSTPAKRRRIESSSVKCSQSQMSLLQYNLDKADNLMTKKELPKSQVGLWIDDSYSLTAASAVLSQTQKPEEQKKITRKRARPGESTRPRPKDRQLIQDRIKELRGIIPNGGKCSIDSLLDRTIKYMVFLQGVTKHGDKLRQSNEPKLIGNENGVPLRDNKSSGGGGATWAFEVGGQSMVCPIIVEDLNPPGQMLIEMLCEEQGFFLEIADIIRGFGLSILKGMMELRENKIWAHFIVEAKSHVTRIDIFWSLVRLLQQTSTNGIDSTNQPSNVILDGGIPQLDSYQKPNLPPPICLTETLH
ncbi:transcription factor bHLH157 [Morus notabilis]|uniref:transcription factor bHLH157 n=1 Tax=Morus notabilis TaxID=981085 RepID=UPI000CED740D|nr:transcription factor bHLH157 [Morus notabilis]